MRTCGLSRARDRRSIASRGQMNKLDRAIIWLHTLCKPHDNHKYCLHAAFYHLYKKTTDSRTGDTLLDSNLCGLHVVSFLANNDEHPESATMIKFLPLDFLSVSHRIT